MKIGFIGLGKLGLPCAEVMAEKGHDVRGYDIVQIGHRDCIQMVATVREAVEDRDIVFIAVPTPHDPSYDGTSPTSHLEPRDFGYDIVMDCIREADRYMRRDQLLVLISTVLPGTTRKQFMPLVTNTQLLYNPYLIAMGSVKWDMTNPEMVIIGTEDGDESGAAHLLVEFYKTVMENDPRYVTGTWDECECIKVFYNTFISTKIGLANMILDVAERQGNINVDVVTGALAASTDRIISSRYLTAGMGDGGSCHPRDNIALRYMAQELGLGYDIFSSIITAREQQARNLAVKLKALSDQHNLPIYIMGRSYKPGVPYVEGSYSLLIDYYLRDLGRPATFVDPLTGDHHDSVQGVILLAHSPSITYGRDASNIYAEILGGSVVLDPWRRYQNPRIEVIHWGNTRQCSAG